MIRVLMDRSLSLSPLDHVAQLASAVGRVGSRGVSLVVALCCGAPLLAWHVLASVEGMFPIDDLVAGPCVRLGTFSLLIGGVCLTWGRRAQWRLVFAGSLFAALLMACNMAMAMDRALYTVDVALFLAYSVMVFAALTRLAWHDRTGARA